jgi:predicted transcriptional regulator
MPELKFDHPVPELTDEEDEETLAAIERGREDIKAGRVFSLEEVRALIQQWCSSSSSPKQQ